MTKDKCDAKHKVTFLPFSISVEMKTGTLLWDAIKKEGLPLKASCGGEGTCGDCVVQIKEGSYSKKASAVLPDKLVSEDYALACKTEITDDLTVQLPQFEELLIKSVVGSDFAKQHKNNISGSFQHKPVLKSAELKLPLSTLEDNYSDLKRLERQFIKELSPANLYCPYSVLKDLARVVRQEEGHIRVTYFDCPSQVSIVNITPASEPEQIFGIACDIGTTTVALYLVDMTSGKIMETASSLNQQTKCGEDIIARINYSQKPGHLDELHDLVVLTINNLIDAAINKTGISPNKIYYGSFSGNTTMIHLLLKLEPNYIREEPYVPTFNHVPLLQAKDLGLRMNPEAKIHCSPSVGSYVGGDITAGMLYTPIPKEANTTSLFIDAGTNGEIVVGNKEWLMTCACSAGPAFEGSGIKCGMPASSGAIEQFEIKKSGDVSYEVINGLKPKGLCGSGLVDLMAELFAYGYIDRHGKFKEQKADDRICQKEDGLAFLVEEARNTFWGKDIVITEKDISNLILTKGAVFSACSLLLKNVGIDFDDIDALYIAGGFGRSLNVENAVRIGLLPDLDRDKFHYIGNSSLLGAYLILLSDKNKSLADAIADKMTYIELNTEPRYMNEFTGSLFLPHTDMDLFPSVKKIFETKNQDIGGKS
ncbi:ASKHA domain-containing protein [Acidobacteriota bacterium]